MRPVTVAETLLFLRRAAALCGEDKHAALVDFIAANPEAGEVIPGTGGSRKVRWSRPGSGKRGGVRVIYFCHDDAMFYHDDAMPLYLLLVHAKVQRESWTRDEKRRARDLIASIKQTYRRR